MSISVLLSVAEIVTGAKRTHWMRAQATAHRAATKKTVKPQTEEQRGKRACALTARANADRTLRLGRRRDERSRTKQNRTGVAPPCHTGAHERARILGRETGARGRSGRFCQRRLEETNA